jgi:hypothetical protein
LFEENHSQISGFFFSATTADYLTICKKMAYLLLKCAHYLKISQFLPAFSWFILSFILLTLPGSTVPRYPWLATIHADKWVHIGLFGMLCLLSMLPFLTSGHSSQQRLNWFLFIAIGGTLYGILMEFVQERWVINRSFEYGDIVADALGCVLAYYLGRRKLLAKGWKKIGPDRNRDRNQN